MRVNVGLMYSIQSFLQYIDKYSVNVIDFENSWKRGFLLAEPSNILAQSLQCGWITIGEDKLINLTLHGQEINYGVSSEMKLRIQLKHFVYEKRPTWAFTFTYGRKEVSKYLPSNIHQWFKEAMLFEDYSREVIEWWDDVTNFIRSIKNERKNNAGRKGEQLSLLHEKERTGKWPIWKAVDSNLIGYDILSYKDKDSSSYLKIESKFTSSVPLKFYLTKNEWETAMNSDAYVFHLWVVIKSVDLYELTVEFIREHLPYNRKNGEWENVLLTFSHDELLPFKKNHQLGSIDTYDFWIIEQ